MLLKGFPSQILSTGCLSLISWSYTCGKASKGKVLEHTSKYRSSAALLFNFFFKETSQILLFSVLELRQGPKVMKIFLIGEHFEKPFVQSCFLIATWHIWEWWNKLFSLFVKQSHMFVWGNCMSAHNTDHTVVICKGSRTTPAHWWMLNQEQWREILEVPLLLFGQSLISALSVLVLHHQLILSYPPSCNTALHE